VASFSTCSRQCDWVHKFRVSSTAAEAAAAREENEDMEPAAQTPREDFDLAQAVQQTAKIETLKKARSNPNSPKSSSCFRFRDSQALVGPAFH